MSKNDNLLKRLQAGNKAAAKANPHKAKRTAKKKTTTPPKRRVLSDINESAARERTSVNLTPEALTALRDLEIFLMVECGARSVTHSAAISIALELTAGSMKSSKAKLTGLLEAFESSDGRRHKNA